MTHIAPSRAARVTGLKYTIQTALESRTPFLEGVREKPKTERRKKPKLKPQADWNCVTITSDGELDPNRFCLDSHCMVFTLSPLNDAGWQFIYFDSTDCKWVDPVTRERHYTAEALKIQESRLMKQERQAQ